MPPRFAPRRPSRSSELAEPWLSSPENKTLYHAFGSFASPLVIALMTTMEQVALAAGIRRKGDIRPIMAPLLWQTLNNYLKT